MTRSTDLIEIEERLGAHNYHPLDVVLTRGEGVWVWDVEGRKYLDCLASYSAVNQGHCHPRIVEAMVEQSRRLALTSRAFRNDRLPALYEKLTGLSGFQRVLPMNTGAEAVETAIKAARKWAYTVKGVPDGEAEILVFTENFHGRTTTIVGFSSEAQYRAGFGPFTPGFRIVPYGDADALAAAMHPNVAAVLVEPIQGEGGIIVPPDGYLTRLREITAEHHALLLVDEIQSGLGRTGTLFAYEHEGIRPDGVILGKALSGGLYPVSAFLADDEVMGVFHPGDHGSTYGGNPVAAATACAALDVLIEERMLENSAELGAYALERLRELAAPHVAEVRGRGLWVGIELEPDAGGARPYCEALQRRGILCKETHEHVIRLAPPLVITREVLDWALDEIEAVLAPTPAAKPVASRA
ncbi:MAG: ornithine--oxo-acid transaminase [Thermoanaerobaculia bacterium]|nr:ornithine--oxo-acid transaminase [Thermoanaerobaculia bacterium]